MSERLGMRIEVRDHIPIYDEGSFEAHYVDFRVGLIFR
jgi:hypothetical protein